MSSSTSENKKNSKDKVENLISSGSADGSSTALAEQQQQQQKLNTFDNNSKKPSTTTFGANIDNSSEDSSSTLKKQEPAVDSGYISGPVTSPSSSGIVSSSQESQQQKQQPDSQQFQGHHKEEKLSNILDSGCIEEPDEEEEIQKEQKQTETDEMRLKHNVDAGITERFCNLSMQSNNEGSAATTTINNLNSTGNAGGGGLRNKEQTQSNTGAATTNITPQNAWQIFYQQNDEGDTPLHLASGMGDEKVVMALIRMVPHPVLFNIQNDLGQAPLHMAALAQKPSILRMLLIAGAEPTVRDRHGNTALHLACEVGDLQCVNALTIPISSSEINYAHRLYGHRTNDKAMSLLKCAQLPSDMEIRNYDGERCVHLAAQGGFIEILRVLVDHGADINAREGKAGRTPLHIAIDTANDELANFLLDECQKLNLETETYAGLTAYQTAYKQKKFHLKDLLEKHGAELTTPPDSDYDSNSDCSDIEPDHDESKNYDRFGDPGYFANYNGGKPPMTVM